VLGPTGAGKSKLARRIFELKKMRPTIAGEFVDVNCATLRARYFFVFFRLPLHRVSSRYLTDAHS
jgi:sigma54-dependent transcription regulator